MSNHMDQFYLYQALELAKIQRGFCAPNPSVGAVIVLNNEVLATGYHLAAGCPHAEIEALKKLNFTAPNATIYVTLEPCCHFGKTPPCTDALIKAGIKRVVYGYRDPNPIVTGKGEAQLAAAGIECEHHPLPELDAFYESYRYWHQTKKPFITAKIALSLDGKMAGKDGEPIQITGKELQIFTHSCRKTSDAILTTSQTINADNPQLNVRDEKTIFRKPIYVLDSHLKILPTANIFTTSQSMTVFHAPTAPPDRQQALIKQGVRCVPVKLTDMGLDLNQIIEMIGNDGIHDLWIEAGGRCFTSFIEQNRVQRALLYLSPQVLREGMPAFTSKLDFRALEIYWKQFGQDVLCEIHW